MPEAENGSGRNSGANWMERHPKLAVLYGFAMFLVLCVGIVHAVHSVHDANLTPADSAASSSDSVQSSEPPSTQARASITPKVYQGTGDDVVTIEKPSDGAAIVSFECPDCTSNTVVKTNGAESLLVNVIGAYSGSHLIDVREGGNTTQVDITASASWTLTVSGIDKAVQASAPTTGHGDTVLHVTGDTAKAAITNTGDSNFVVNVYPADGGMADLAVNTIGSYKGTVPMSLPAYVQIDSNGDWTVSPS